MKQRVLVGPREKIKTHDQELAGRQVKQSVRDNEPAELPYRPANGPSTAESLLKHAGTWVGDDLEECLELVYATRSKARF